jgi:hypothetical protein
VPALDLAAEPVYIYKTAHHPSLVRDCKVPVIDVGLATVAAQTYFPIHLSEQGAYVDGALWARNPDGAGGGRGDRRPRLGARGYPRAEPRLHLAPSRDRLGQARLLLGCASPKSS